jgi:CcmD family protein
MAVWAVFFVYQITIGRRMARLQDEIERLKNRLK